jgi:hypothetical protein
LTKRRDNCKKRHLLFLKMGHFVFQKKEFLNIPVGGENAIFKEAEL